MSLQCSYWSSQRESRHPQSSVSSSDRLFAHILTHIQSRWMDSISCITQGLSGVPLAFVTSVPRQLPQTVYKRRYSILHHTQRSAHLNIYLCSRNICSSLTGKDTAYISQNCSFVMNQTASESFEFYSML